MLEGLLICGLILALCKVDTISTLKGNAMIPNVSSNLVEEGDPLILAKEQQRLIEDLFKDYDNNVRPVQNPNNNLSIRIIPSVRRIVEIYWYDKTFVWNKTDYSNISNFFVEADKIWLPDISLYNSAEEGQDALIYHKMKTKVQVYSDGERRWHSPYFSSTSCNIDSTHFPFDEQTCQVEMASWTAAGNVIDVQLGTNLTIDTSNYLENIQWKLQSTKAYKQVKFYSSNIHPFPSLVFEFVVRRRSLFYIVNLIFPCVILSFLSLMTFYIPPASGERITLSISLLLAMLFTLYIVNENLSPDSTTVPLLIKFIRVAMLIMTLSLIGISLPIKFKDKKEPVPKWVSLVVGKYLACLVLRDKSWIRRCPKRNRRCPEEMTLDDQSPNDKQRALLEDEEIQQPQNPQKTCRLRSPQSSWNKVEEGADSGETSVGPKPSSPAMSSIAEMLQWLSSRVQINAAVDEAQGEWNEIGMILNTLFFGTFFAVLFFSTVSIFIGAKYTE